MEVCQRAPPKAVDRRATDDAAASRVQRDLALAKPWVRPLHGSVGMLHARLEPLHQRGAAAKREVRLTNEKDGTVEPGASTIPRFALDACIVRVHRCTKKIDACTPRMDARMSGVRRRSK